MTFGGKPLKSRRRGKDKGPAFFTGQILDSLLLFAGCCTANIPTTYKEYFWDGSAQATVFLSIG